MNNPAFLKELRAALRRQGIWGARTERLMNDWQEHVDEDTAKRLQEGATPETAREAAWQALGSPNVLAAKAGSELANASWLGRHPWTGGLVLPGLTWFALLLAISILPAWGASLLWNIESLEKSHLIALEITLRCWEVVFNWLPWMVAMAWLARTAARMPGGWRLYWITAVALTVFVPSLWVSVQMPLHGPGSGSVMFTALGFLGIFVRGFFYLLGYGAESGPSSIWFRQIGAHPGPLIQTALMALGTIAFYGRMTGRYGRMVTGAGAIVLFLLAAVICGAPTYLF